MIWVGRAGVVGPMAVDTIHRQSGELIADMTIFAQHRLVGTGQRELRVIMRERCWLPA